MFILDLVICCDSRTMLPKLCYVHNKSKSPIEVDNFWANVVNDNPNGNYCLNKYLDTQCFIHSIK